MGFSTSGSSKQDTRADQLSTLAPVRLIGAPYAHGQPLQGVALGPATIRSTGLHHRLRQAGVAFEDSGDLPLIERLEDDTEFTINSRTCSVVAAAIAASHREGFQPVLLGGDHALGLGSACGTLRGFPNAGLIWVDAHGDVNTPDVSASGNFHGMPVAALLGLFDKESLKDFPWLDQTLSPQRLVYIGVRDLDDGERKILKDREVLVFTSENIRNRGVEACIEEAALALEAAGCDSVHLSFDIDAVDPNEAPATGVRAKDGLTAKEARRIATRLATRLPVVTLDLVEVNPEACPTSLGIAKTAELARDLIVEVLSASQSRNPCKRKSHDHRQLGLG